MSTSAESTRRDLASRGQAWQRARCAAQNTEFLPTHFRSFAVASPSVGVRDRSSSRDIGLCETWITGAMVEAAADARRRSTRNFRTRTASSRHRLNRSCGRHDRGAPVAARTAQCGRRATAPRGDEGVARRAEKQPSAAAACGGPCDRRCAGATRPRRLPRNCWHSPRIAADATRARRRSECATTSGARDALERFAGAARERPRAATPLAHIVRCARCGTVRQCGSRARPG
jgi:hypothetical protein